MVCELCLKVVLKKKKTSRVFGCVAMCSAETSIAVEEKESIHLETVSSLCHREYSDFWHY